MQIKMNPAAFAAKINDAFEYLNDLNPRAEGLHVSDLIRCSRMSWYARNGYPKAEHSVRTKLMFMLGQGHHVILQKAREERHPEVVIAGHRVTGSVDDIGLHADGTTEIPEEYKSTRGGINKSLWPASHYVEQVATYAWMMGRTFARIFVVYMLGDRGADSVPDGRTYELTFEPEEMAAWGAELERRTLLVMADEVPPLREHRSWECDYCPFNKKLGGPCQAGLGGERGRKDFFQKVMVSDDDWPEED